MKTCHVRFRGIPATPELLRAIREHEAVLQRELEPGGSCEAALIERADDGKVRVTLRLRLGVAVDLHVYQHAPEAMSAVQKAFWQAIRRAQQQSPPSSGVRSARPGPRRAPAHVFGSTGTA